MYTLGINAAFHDTAAALVKDGRVIAAAEEERFNRVKHGKRPIPFSAYELPFHAIDYCLREAGITLAGVDHVGYSYDPFLRLGKGREKEVLTLPLEPSAFPVPDEWEAAWDPLFLSFIVNAPRHLVGGVPHHLEKRFRDARIDLSRWHFIDHHLCHAASAFYASPFDEAAILTMDGRGEKATTTYGTGRGSQVERIGQVDMPHSLGMLYEQVTSHLGFLHSSDEYKVMALASFGRPRYLTAFRNAIRVGEEGQYQIETGRLWKELGPPRLPGEPLRQRHKDIAHSLQGALEESVLKIVRWLHQVTKSDNLCMAGGVALNCVLNSSIREQGSFRNVWVQPAAGDAGSALGAALLVDVKERHGAARPYRMEHVFLGPGYSDRDIEQALRSSGLPVNKLENVAEQTAKLLEKDMIVGWFQGRMEFGPRALGARSILASPLHADMQTRLNFIKEREDFRPVAPVVIEEEAPHWFSVNGSSSPFMLFVYDVLSDRAARIPAVCHIDGTARIQTINRDQNPRYYELLRAFQSRTGVPVLVNTSFNTRGRPIVCSPQDALECFWTTPLDALVMGTYLLTKQRD
ncbi:MAG: Decarbamoylnovobiocin carbamoyltransferase [Syntrophorhabdaceae bacterium PtaU1.Bin034]|nr:MAG: Decarbamoylnovobiocin carbamoyltransferase [Syntrophorhabdaceae bacterium PtaU1.Bin034]